MEQTSGQDSVPPPGSFDKSRILNIRPLRCLFPVFPSTPHGLSGNPQASAPFVCAAPTGPFPAGAVPFYPFFTSPEQNSQGVPSVFSSPISNAVPINSFRTPLPSTCGVMANGGASSSKRITRSSIQSEDGFLVTDANDTGRTGRAKSKSQKRTRVVQDVDSALLDVNVDSIINDFLASIDHAAFDTLRQNDRSRELVELSLLVFDLLRRRVSQVEEAKESNPVAVRRPDLKAGAVLMSKGIRTNNKKQIGVVPGIEIGDIFFFRMELCLVGLHSPSMGGIDYMSVKLTQEEEPLAVSIVSSGGYEDDGGEGDVLIYSGQGGNKDQKLERGNLALEKSLRRGNHVRVVRGISNANNPNAKIYVYDGLYKIQESWVEKGKSGFSVFKYKLIRLPDQPEAYTTWKAIQQWIEMPTSRDGIILPDLTSGAEGLPVCLVNGVDDEKGPAYFTYYPTLKYSKPSNPVESSGGCSCIGGCQPSNVHCSCIQKNGGYLPYTTNGVLVNVKTLIYECGPSCQCPPNCKNRVSQGGLKVRLEVFKTNNKGWGLRSWDPIRAGAFICEYAGEVIDQAKVAELVANNEDDYIFYSTHNYQTLGVFSSDSNDALKTPYPLFITAKNVGNVARFMNHSCSPNVFWRLILRENKNEADLHVVFHALRHIPPMTELTYDYGIDPHLQAGQKKKCLCGSAKCRGHIN